MSPSYCACMRLPPPAKTLPKNASRSHNIIILYVYEITKTIILRVRRVRPYARDEFSPRDQPTRWHTGNARIYYRVTINDKFEFRSKYMRQLQYRSAYLEIGTTDYMNYIYYSYNLCRYYSLKLDIILTGISQHRCLSFILFYRTLYTTHFAVTSIGLNTAHVILWHIVYVVYTVLDTPYT